MDILDFRKMKNLQKGLDATNEQLAEIMHLRQICTKCGSYDDLTDTGLEN